MLNRDRRLKAAADLEELAAELKDIVQEIREDDHETLDWCYARVYEFRTRLGYVVSALGFGMPPMLYRLVKEMKQRD